MAAWNPGEVILGDYLVEKELGRGGMGRVWLVKSNSTGRQFAVKQALLREEDHRKAFLTELQIWIDLPEHPNIVSCRFFRTVGDEIVIFADYIAGGSLADWIAQRKLTTLEQILDVAIQFAWGLHAIHERGLIHQDVKPGNVLLTTDGIPMVTDFGLARARFRAADGDFISPALLPGQHSVPVPGSGWISVPYASPEQCAGKPLSRNTDIWSWGVSVLEMFMGGVSWARGDMAAKVLEDFLENGQMEAGLLEMPGVVAGLLAQCFVRDPTARVVKLNLIAETLIGYLEYFSGRKYGRKTPQVGGPIERCVQHDRLHSGVHWQDPREWLRRAYEVLGLNPVEAGQYHPAAAYSRKGAGLVDMAIYDEAERLFQKAIDDGKREVRELLAGLYMEKALLCRSLDDSTGCLHVIDRCIAILRQLVEEEGRLEFANGLALAFMDKAIMINDIGDLGGAVEHYDRCIAIWQRLVDEEGRSVSASDLALALMNKATAIKEMGDPVGAVVLYDQCISIHQRLVDQGGRPKLDNFAMVLMNKANAIQQMGDLAGAVEIYGQCIDIYRQLTREDDRWDLANELARSVQNKANAIQAMGDNAGAIELYDQCITILRRLVEQDNRQELAYELARAFMNKAVAIKAIGELTGADSLYDQCIAIYKRLVEQEGRSDLANEHATALLGKSRISEAMGDLVGTVALHDQCISIYKRLVEHDGRNDLTGKYGLALAYRANCLMRQGKLKLARDDAQEGIALIKQEIARTSNNDLKRVLAWAEITLTPVIG